MADLIRHLEIPCAIDFMAVSSYGSATSSSGVVRILKDLDTDIEGRHVIIVEDIVDSGLTLDYLVKNLRSRKPASLEVLSLLTKPSRREVELPVRYVGFEVPDVFVVGYGLDYAERYRNLSASPRCGPRCTARPEVAGAAWAGRRNPAPLPVRPGEPSHPGGSIEPRSWARPGARSRAVPPHPTSR